MPNSKWSIGAIVAATLSSSCCLLPLIALATGATSLSVIGNYITPFRPLLIGLSVLVLGALWHLTIRKARNLIKCNCSPSVLKKEIGLTSLVTLICVAAFGYPILASSGGVEQSKPSIKAEKTIVVRIDGMTCESCERHVNNALSKVTGVVASNTSYAEGKTKIMAKNTVNISEILNAIEKMGYKPNIEKSGE